MADVKLKTITDTGVEEVEYTGVTSIDAPLSDGSGNASFIIPSGSIDVTANGTVDVTNYASAIVNVAGGGEVVTGGYTVTFSSDGTIYAVSSVTAGDSVSAPNTNPSKSGYAFKGWGSSLVVTESDITFPYTPTADTTLYAVYSMQSVIGCTGFDNSTGNLTWTDDIADLQSSDAYTTSTSGDYVSLTSAIEDKFPFNSLTEVTDDSDNVFIRFPKMYWKWETSGNVVTGFKVSNTQIDSSYFIPDCFLNPNTDQGGYLDYVDIGKYEGSGSSSMIYSKSGATCLASQTRKTCRTAARNYGTSANYYNGYQQYDFSMMTMYNYLVNLFVRTANIQNVYAGRTSQSSAASTGSCDGVTGMNGWNTSTTCVKFLGVENPYGNIYKWVDGVYFSSSTIYVHRYPIQFADATTNGITLGFSRPTLNNYIFQISRGTADTTQSYAYCSAVSSSSTTYYDDYCYYNSSETVLCVGGRWNTGSNAGLWTLTGNLDASNSGTYAGCRLSRRPVS